MKLSVILSAVMLTMATFSTLYVEAQGIVIRQAAKSDNPSVRIGAISGSSAMAQQVRSDIKNCGWFDVVDNDKADYVLTGAASASSLQLRLDKSQGGSGSVSINQSNIISVSETSHRAVDLLLNKVFDIKGICAYKIAFSLEIAPNVKEIFICDFDGKNAQQITRNQTQSIEAEWGPKNQSILYTLYGAQNTQVAETQIKSKMSRRLSQYRGMNAAPSIASNSSNYACVMSKDGAVELYLRNIGGTALRRLTKGKGVEASPCFSPAGNQICFVSDMAQLGKPRLYIISANGGTPVPVQTTGTDATSPDWSLDNKLVYSAKTGSGNALCVTDLSGKAKMGVGEVIAGRFESPSWAPDNRHVVAQYTTGRKAALWIIDTWTGKSRPLFSVSKNASLPTWQKR